MALAGFSALSSGRKLITDDIACGELSPILATASDLQVYSRDTGASEVSEQAQRDVSFPVAHCCMHDGWTTPCIDECGYIMQYLNILSHARAYLHDLLSVIIQSCGDTWGSPLAYLKPSPPNRKALIGVNTVYSRQYFLSMYHIAANTLHVLLTTQQRPPPPYLAGRCALILQLA